MPHSTLRCTATPIGATRCLISSPADSFVAHMISSSSFMPHARIQAAPRRPILLLWGILIFLAVICAYVVALALVAFCIALSIAGITSMSLIGIVLGAWAAVGA